MRGQYGSVVRVLCTNDDGIAAPGIPVLAGSLLDVADDVFVAAPETDMSGSGTSILVPGAADRSIRIRPHTYVENPDIAAVGVTGTPAMNVLLAHRGIFGEPPDVVVSGPNFGANTGHDVHHSGTVGAALTAVKLGMHGIAVSVAVGVGAEPQNSGRCGPHWETAASLTKMVVRAIAHLDPERPVFLNMNVPDRPIDDLVGIRTVGLAQGSPYRVERFDESTEEGGIRVLQAALVIDGHGHGPETDIGSLREGAVTISWLSVPGDGEPAVTDLHDIVAAMSEASESFSRR